METGKPFSFGGNVMNTGLIDNRPADCCVEVTCLANEGGIQPCHIGALPHQLAALNLRQITVHQVAVDAALTGKKDYIYQAAMLDPHASAELSIDEIRAMDVSSSKYAYQWKDSKGIRKQSVLVVDKDGLKLYTLSGKENQPDIQSEMVDLKTSDKIQLNTKLPEYEYTGKDLRIKAVFDETKKKSDEDKEEGLVTIPMLNIYKIVETKSGAEVYANFWSETYYRYGSLLKNYSGGSYPGVMYLKKTKDGYRVTKTRYAEDGESLERSIWKLCKGYPDVAIRMMKDSVTQNQRKKVLQKYVSQNKLKIKAYKEYGWQYVNL